MLLYYDFSVNQKKHLSAPLCTTAFSIGAIEHCVPAVLCRFLGHQQMWKGKERAAARARDEWEKRGEESRIGGSSEAPSPDPRSGAGIKVACFMWLVQHFEVPESPTALTSSSSLVS